MTPEQEEQLSIEMEKIMTPSAPISHSALMKEINGRLANRQSQLDEVKNRHYLGIVPTLSDDGLQEVRLRAIMFELVEIKQMIEGGVFDD